VLDKTGTITEGTTALVTWVGPEWVKPLVLALEDGSSHPLADGFRRAWSGLTMGVVQESKHVAGGGLEGVVDGHHVRIGSPRFVRASAIVSDDMQSAIDAIDRTLTPVYVAVDGTVVAAAGLGDRVRDDARAALETLRAAGWRTIMLSGDAPEVVSAVGSSLGFAASDAIGSASPEDKLAFVERLKRDGRVVMVGDGVNDAAAIAAAHVGIGVHGGAEACLSTADVYLTRPGLSALVELTQGSRNTMHVIRRNIAFSIGYNIIGAGLAVIGLLNPLIAAVLMPTSSITVVLGSWYGTSFSRSNA
jgi:Cu2+-exporting ATPase